MASSSSSDPPSKRQKASSSGIPLTILAFNVNGLRAVWRAGDGDGAILKGLVRDQDPDVLFLSEIKVDEEALTSILPAASSASSSSSSASAAATSDIRGFFAPKAKKRAPTEEEAAAAADSARLLPGYRQHFNHAEQKGYSGTAVFLRIGHPLLDRATVTFDGLAASLPEGVDATAADRARLEGEGRLITVDVDGLVLVHTYVPNVGRKMEKLDFRTRIWDAALFAYLRNLRNLRDLRSTGTTAGATGATGATEGGAKGGAKGGAAKGVLWCGDLNVIRGEADQAVFMKKRNKAPGCSDAERASFGMLVGGIDPARAPTESKPKTEKARAALMEDFPQFAMQAVPGPFGEGERGGEGGDFVDVYRELHPYPIGGDGEGGGEGDGVEVKGEGKEGGGDGAGGDEGLTGLAATPFTYWSMMGGGKRTAENGWRLDYFVLSRNMLGSVTRCFHLPHIKGSDHVPIGLELQL